ncbi:GON-4-like protein [Anabrus simplex]|uniref:GON-4-like protein n=1 Tax=Anabrus simplex TaxID=316456 RepID=UPI0035A37777
MLPSMPLISTPLKEPAGDSQRNETISGNGLEVPITPVNYQSADGASAPLTDAAVCGTTNAIDACSQHVEKQNLRPIAPKPVVVVISTPTPTFAAVPQVTTTEILPAVSDSAQLPADTEAPKQNDETHTEQPVEQQVELQVSEQKDDSQSSEEKKTAEPTERKDDEDELAALMLASTTIRSSPKSRSANAAKKKSKHIRDIEATLNLLAPDSDDVKNDKAFGYAQAYFMKVTERLEGKDNALYQEFLKTINDFGHTIFSVPELYHKITAMFHGHPDLAEEFLTFLLPEQAMECGKFMEHLMLTKMKDFFRMLEVYFAKQPQQMRKIYSSLSALSSQSNVTLQDVRSAILPLLKGNSLLADSFLQLLPQERPPDSIVSEFEEMDCGDADSYHSGDDQFETVEVPDQKDMYGGDQCLCVCHETGDDKYRRRAVHCVSCGTKFIYGRVFVQTGKVLRPAKVVFDVDKNRTIKRLSAKEGPKKSGRKKSVFRYNKDATPTKSHNEEGRHDSETVSPKSRSCKSRTPAVSCKKVACKQSSSCKTSGSEGSKSTFKDTKTSTCHSTRIANSVGASKSRLEPPHNVPVKKPTLVTKPVEKQSASSSLKEIPSLLSSSDELSCLNNDKEIPLEPINDSQNLDTSMVAGDPDILSPECVITETVSPLPPATLDECATTLPPDSTPGETVLQDFSSLSQVLGSKESDVYITAMDIPDQPENLSCKSPKKEVSTAIVRELDVKEEACDLSMKTRVAENGVPQASCEEDLNMEVDCVDESNPGESTDKKFCPTEAQGPSHDKPFSMSWTREEDKIILQMFQMECNAEQTFQKISQHLSQRSVDEIRERFSTLMNLLEQMTGVKMEQEIIK